MKTPKELNAIKEEVYTLSSKLAELTEEELAQVTGGAAVAGGTLFSVIGTITGDFIGNFAEEQ